MNKNINNLKMSFYKCVSAALLSMFFSVVYANNLETKEFIDNLQKSAKTKNYKANVIVQKQKDNNFNSKMFAVIHYYDGQSEFEKITPLEGKMRNVLRINQMVQAYLDEKKIIISTKRDDANFPFLTNNSTQVASLYTMKKLANERILGKNTQVVILEPKDKYRYEYKLWLHDGLLLKSQTIFTGKILEQIVFSDIQDISLNKNEIQEWMHEGENWQYKLPRLQEFDIDKLNWKIPKKFKGYEYIKSKHRINTTNEKPPMYQIIYSDGLGSVSIFIEEGSKHIRESNQGNNYLASKQMGKYTVTAVGEAPPVLLEELLEVIDIDIKK